MIHLTSHDEGSAVDLGLVGKAAIVTGGSMGIGKAAAERLAAEGCDVAIVARDEARLASVAADIANRTGSACIGLTGDMAQTPDVNRVVDAAASEFGGLDICVPNAGSSPGGLLGDLTDDQWNQSLQLKFMGHVRTVRAAIPHLRARGGGSIVMVVGNDGLKPSYWEMTAGVANAADINFASSVAEQYARDGIRCNTVNPGPVATSRWETLEAAFARDKGVSAERAHELAMSSLPLGSMCSAEQVADLVAFLASPRSGYITGAHIPIDGAQRKALMDL